MRSRSSRRFFARCGVATLTAALGFAATYRLAPRSAGRQTGPPAQAENTDATAKPSQPAETQGLVFVYIGSATCAASTRADVRAATQALLRAVRSAVRSQTALTTVGVAVDWSVEEGRRHLRRVARFDQLSLGGSWHGLGAIRYIWADVPGPAATPQVILLRRSGSGGSVDPLRAPDERVLVRLVGVVEILRARDRLSSLSWPALE